MKHPVSHHISLDIQAESVPGFATNLVIDVEMRCLWELTYQIFLHMAL